MPSETIPESSAFRDAAARVGEKVADVSSAARTTAADLGRSTVSAADNNRQAAARGLQTAAETLRERADSLPGGPKVAEFATGAADTLSSTAEYVRQHDVRSMMEDLERLVKNNPGPCLLTAAAIGFLVGRAVSRD